MGGSVLREPEFRALAVTGLVSATGDQLARVALSVLVYDRTASALLTAATYALTYLPAVAGGPLLAGLADRLPRRRLMVVTALGQAVLVGLMAVPRLPLPVLLTLLVGVGVLAAPFGAARAALMPDVTGDRYVAALVVDRTFQQTAQVLGFLGGGLLLLAVGPSGALVGDAASFAATAVLVRRSVRARPAAAPATRLPATGVRETAVATARSARWRRAVSDARVGWDTIRSDRRARGAVLLTWLVSAVAIVPEGLAAPYARELVRGPLVVALLLAANPAGNVLSGLWVRRWSRGRPGRVFGSLGQLVALPLALCLLDPPTAVVLVLVVVSGIGMTVTLLARAVFVANVAAPVRGRAFGVAAAGIGVAQGVAVAIAGAAATFFSPSTIVGGAGVVGAAAVGLLLIATR